MIVRRIPRYREPVRCVHADHAQMNIPDLIDGSITWQSTLPCRANQETPSVGERVFQNRGVCGQAFPSLLSPPPPRTFLRPPQFSRGQKSEKCIERAESLTETLATQASFGWAYKQGACKGYKKMFRNEQMRSKLRLTY